LVMIKSVDTIYAAPPRKAFARGDKKSAKFSPSKEKPLFYFYKSLQAVLSIWIFTILVITLQPWADYWVKSTIKNKNKQTLGEISTTQSTPASSTKIQYPKATFSLKNAQVEIKAPIVEGIDEAALKQGIGHHPDSVWPSEKGNIVLAGHNVDLDAENPYGKVFISLRLVNVGDEVTIVDRGKTYHYRVFKKETVSPSDTSLFGKVDDWILTFYTCDPPYTDWKRLVLQAKLTRIE